VAVLTPAASAICVIVMEVAMVFEVEACSGI
jgi:hypothetical protein